MPVSRIATFTPPPVLTRCAAGSPMASAAGCSMVFCSVPRPSSKAKLFWRASAGTIQPFASCVVRRASPVMARTRSAGVWLAPGMNTASEYSAFQESSVAP